jgi:tetratricopeptide (TPR) repeat protein
VKNLLSLCLLLAVACAKEGTVSEPQSSELPSFDALWNFDDPAGTETRFRELLAKAKESADPGYAAELQTQIARTQGLQQKFDEAHATLDRVDASLKPDMKTAKVRSLLERGRVFNSSGKAKESIPTFKEALRVAQESGLENYAIDAVHMLGIAEKGQGIAELEPRSHSPRRSRERSEGTPMAGPSLQQHGVDLFRHGAIRGGAQTL